MWATWVPGMAVPAMGVVNAGLAATFAGAGLLLLAGLVWAWRGNGIEAGPAASGAVRVIGATGWLLWIAGLVIQVAGQFGPVGVARWLTAVAH
ncbi:MAG TPA: hypothetical protein VLD61_11765 [Methylomirabilota bacterium]|nr:hypothetical protein [Methylomirabilota bacterium]